MNGHGKHGIVAARHAPKAAAAGGGADAGPGTVVIDGGGVVLSSVNLQLIFWGTPWATGTTPPSSSVTAAATAILTSSYMSSLSQYRGVGIGHLIGTFTLANAIGAVPADPPNPFSSDDVTSAITELINDGLIPGPATDLLYMMILPPGVNSNQSGLLGEHAYFALGGLNVHYGWVTNDGTLDFVTTVFSHELVESCTDPEGTAIQLDSAGICAHNPTSWCEIADVCTSNAVINGVRVQSYWSQTDGRCVVP
jgi:hypothetical protein